MPECLTSLTPCVAGGDGDGQGAEGGRVSQAGKEGEEGHQPNSSGA